MPTLSNVLDVAFRSIGAMFYIVILLSLIMLVCFEVYRQIKYDIERKNMKLYGAEVSQRYIQYNDNKKRHIRYPRSEEYPYEARNQEKWGNKYGS